MPVAEVIALVSLSVTLLCSVVAMLAYMYRVGSLVATLTASIAEVRKWGDRVELVPILVKGQENLEAAVADMSRKLSEFPRMRERLDSISEDVRDAELPKMQARLAVIEKVHSTRSMPAVRLPREEPGK
jgi:hypothetical protein